MTEPCCDYRDHSSGTCACPEHEKSELHPFGYRPYFVGGHCTDCGLNASRCDCGEQCLCGTWYRPRRGEKACHKLVEVW